MVNSLSTMATTMSPVLAGEGGAKYALLSPNTLNQHSGKALRDAVLHHWKSHWGHIREIVRAADIDTFIGFIKDADRARLWEHVGLVEWHVPYIFLATCEFPPSANQKARELRPDWLRFRFDSRVRTLDDLWIRTTGNPGIISDKLRVANEFSNKRFECK
jgi:hypothetical protein